MGYTTEFDGHFLVITKHDGKPSLLPVSIKEEIDDLYCNDDWRVPMEKRRFPKAPATYCQWKHRYVDDFEDDEVNSAIEWDGCEKFYQYIAWLQYIIDDILLPRGWTLSGTVQYSGEETDDAGILTIVDDKVVKKTLKQLVKETAITPDKRISELEKENVELKMAIIALENNLKSVRNQIDGIMASYQEDLIKLRIKVTK